MSFNLKLTKDAQFHTPVNHASITKYNLTLTEATCLVFGLTFIAAGILMWFKVL